MNQNLSRWSVLWSYRFYFIVGVTLCALSLCSRISRIEGLSNYDWTGAQAVIEHVLANIGLMVFAYGLTCTLDYIPGKTRDGLKHCKQASWGTAVALVLANFAWEWGQGHSKHIAAIYNLPPRGYIQWEHVLADWLGILLALIIVDKFIRSTTNRLATLTATAPSLS